MKKSIALLLAFCVLCALLYGCSSEPATKTGFYFDTVITITIYDGDQSAIEPCFELCKKYDALFDMYSPGSDVYRLNHSPGEWTQVDGDVAELLTLGKKYSELSGNEFSICCGRVTGLWDFGAEQPVIPDVEALSAACRTTNSGNLVIEGSSARLDNGAEVDAGGIAKGYITAKLRDELVSRGVKSAIINLGGNICVIGETKKIGVQSPFSPNELTAVLELSDKCAVTSGTYQRYFELDNVRYHHILSLTDGMPASSDLCSATVIADDPTLCDAFSTVCVLYGSERALELINSTDGCECVLVKTDGSVIMTDGARNAAQ